MKYLIVIIFFVLSCTVYGQDMLDDLVVPEDYKERHVALGIHELAVKHFYNAGIDNEKFEEYLELGFDLRQISRTANFPYQKAVLYSDVIVIGEIVGREYNTKVDAEYRTCHKIKVERVLHNGCELAEKDIEIVNMKSVSGPIEDGGEATSFMRVSCEPTYYIGQKCLFFFEQIEPIHEFMLANGSTKSAEKISLNDFIAINSFEISENVLSVNSDNRIVSDVVTEIKSVLKLQRNEK